MPYPHYQRVVKAKREKEKRLEEQLRLTQMASRKKRKELIKPKLVLQRIYTLFKILVFLIKVQSLTLSPSLPPSLLLSFCSSCRGKGRWKDTTKSLEPSLGKFSRGVLKLSQKDISSVKTKNKRTKTSSKQ